MPDKARIFTVASFPPSPWLRPYQVQGGGKDERQNSSTEFPSKTVVVVVFVSSANDGAIKHSVTTGKMALKIMMHMSTLHVSKYYFRYTSAILAAIFNNFGQKAFEVESEL